MKKIFGTKQIQYREIPRWKYQILSPVAFVVPIYPEVDIATPFINLSSKGVLEIAERYAWNGANVISDTEKNMRGSLIHDALYQLLRDGQLDKKWKLVADSVFEWVCVADGTWPVLGAAYEKALAIFGWTALKKDESKPIIFYAPSEVPWEST
jgi:hypothetical protein